MCAYWNVHLHSAIALSFHLFVACSLEQVLTFSPDFSHKPLRCSFWKQGTTSWVSEWVSQLELSYPFRCFLCELFGCTETRQKNLVGVFIWRKFVLVKDLEICSFNHFTSYWTERKPQFKSKLQSSFQLLVRKESIHVTSNMHYYSV